MSYYPWSTNSYGVIQRNHTLPLYQSVYQSIKKGAKSLPTEAELNKIFNNAQFLDPYEHCHYDNVNGISPHVKDIRSLHIHQLFTREDTFDLTTDMEFPVGSSYENGVLKIIYAVGRQFSFHNWDGFDLAADYLRGCTSGYITHITNWLIESLRKEEFFAIRSDQDLIDEVNRRKKQYPYQKIYGFVGTQMADYIHQVRGGQYLDIDWIRVPNSNEASFSGCKTGISMEAWESGIIATSQIKWTNLHKFTWTKERVPRAWYITLTPKWIFRAEISKCEKKESKLIEQPRTTHYQRAINLELNEEEDNAY